MCILQALYYTQQSVYEKLIECTSNSKNFVPHNSFIGILEKQNTSWGVDPLYRVRTYASMRKTLLNFKIKLKIQLNFCVQKIIKIRE
jgi:hypothetical protein